MKKVYFATPVNGRTEPTLALKKDAALKRCVEVRMALKRSHPDWVITYSFMVCPINQVLTEAEAMGRCVTMLMDCDVLILDDEWMQSKGCALEQATAKIYGKEIHRLKNVLEEPKKIVKI